MSRESGQHEEYEILLTGYVDGELNEEDRRRVEEHLHGCSTCTAELAGFRRLNDLVSHIKIREPQDPEIDRFWRALYNRMEWRGGWLLLLVGSFTVTAAVVVAVLTSSMLHWSLKAGLVAMAAGLLLLFLSVLRLRLRTLPFDRYREVHR